MLDFLCIGQPRYDYGERPGSSPVVTPSVPAPLEWLRSLWQAPTPRYEGQSTAVASSTSRGLLCWLFGSPTPVYQAAPTSGASSSSSSSDRTSGGNYPGR